MNTLKSEAQWSDLPQEIRGKILEYVPGRFAGICRDWQNAIEPRNFRVLQVGSDDQSLGNLAKTLHNNINLEISASSPNDVGNSCGIEGLLDYWQQQQRYVFASISLGDFSLPYVNCVTGLSIVSTEIAHNSLRTVEASQYAGTELFKQWYSSESQPVFYPTSSHSMEDSLISDIDLTTMLAIWSYREKPLLSKIHIFEHGDLQMLYNWRLSVRLGLIGNLFIRCLDLEKLVICNIADAIYFFAACTSRVCVPISPLPWQRLRVLTMICQDACSRKKPGLINTLLSQDGRVAKKMPALRVMELYGAWRESAGVFRYLVTGNYVEITWVSTWEFKLGDEPKYIWWDVAQLTEDRLVLLFAPERHLRTYDGPFHFVHQWSVTRGLALHSS
ncbi:hypothetical protein CTAM01_11847 [Colletotrichum tamarilloi]|uniref:DUF6546 domain-containing protein n=1 Tax=Colletotrichum tamarilloi TaxID=1209934 RepID=A0ABQ9QWF2_9PEZI|nr:uncharacterized protein CTAM01_11847 [Colletotrichum tamarilloi]KAK1487390.1 hypothetical protein CTAM01_11847 [Colletotrichum tamarilloi]